MVPSVVIPKHDPQQANTEYALFGESTRMISPVCALSVDIGLLKC